MRTPVHLYLRVRLPDGSYPYLKAAYSSNGRLRPNHAIHHGRAAEFPGSVYCLRFRRADGKRVWEPVGTDASLALAKLQQKTLALQNGNDSVVPVPVTPPNQKFLNAAIREFLTEMQGHRSRKTYLAYEKTLHLFSPSSDDTGKSPELKRAFDDCPLDQLMRTDVLDFIAFLKTRGNAPRTIRNRVDYLQIFFHHFGLKSLLKGKDLPTYTEKKARAYNAGQLSKLFAHSTQDDADLLHFFLCTGAREQEVEYVCWPDVDLDLKTYTVTEHLDLGYTPKDKEEGGLPIPDLLVDVLKARRARYPSTRLIFPGKHGKPDGHLLRRLKQLALRAGVNCGHCDNKKGQSCAVHPVCKQFVLHKLRKTFATTLHHQGLPAQTLQRYLRHSDLDTTIKYIADADDETVRKTINSTFPSGFGFAGGVR